MTTIRRMSVSLYPVALIVVLTLTGCSTAPKQKGEIIEPVFPADRILQEGVVYEGERIISDPLEGLNRRIYRFNYYFDRYLFLPAVRTYKAVTPDIVETGFHNFFRNLQDVTTLINSILQLSPEKTLHTLTRLSLNSTVGLLGFIEIADDVPRSDEDFGQTLGHWGVGTGPYLVLPILGPSSLRDGVGYGVDWAVRTALWDAATDFETWQDWAITILWGIDVRAHVAFRYYETGSPFEYELVRMLWTTKRQLDVER
ncbi:MAG: VacJ family lipoprotein [Gammaproteobacteria bacterium]